MDKVLYVLILMGVCLWQFPVLYGLYAAFRSRVYIRQNLRKVTDRSMLLQRSPLGQHLAMVMKGADTEGIFASLENFYLSSVVLGIGSGLAAYLAAGPFMALLCGVFMGLLPYGILTARLYRRRVARSKEGDILLQELLNNYKIHDFNMKEAIEVKLAKGLQRSVTKNEVERHLATFRYGLDTAWGNALATNIFFAHLYGIRVDSALEDLLRSMIKSRKVVEHGKRENNEARLILKYLAPVSFFLTVAGACRYFDFTLAKFIRYQFGTSLGLQWFLIMTMMYFASLLLNVFLSREKMDI